MDKIDENQLNNEEKNHKQHNWYIKLLLLLNMQKTRKIK